MAISPMREDGTSLMPSARSVRLDLVRGALRRAGRDRSPPEGLLQAGGQLVPVEVLPVAVALDDTQTGRLDALVGGEPRRADVALPAAADGGRIIEVAGIDDPRISFATAWAAHRTGRAPFGVGPLGLVSRRLGYTICGAGPASGGPGLSGSRWPAWRLPDRPRSRHIATMPTAGPSASTANAMRHAVGSSGAKAPSARMVTLVRVNPAATCTRQRRASRAARRQLGDGRRELCGVGDDRQTPDQARGHDQDRRASEQQRHDQCARATRGHRGDGRGRSDRADPLADPRRCTRVRRCRRRRTRPARRQCSHRAHRRSRGSRPGRPAPRSTCHRAPTCDPGSRASARRTAGSRKARAASAGLKRGAGTSNGPSRVPNQTRMPPTTAAGMPVRRRRASRRPT